MPTLSNVEHQYDYSFYDSDEWKLEICQSRWLQSGEEDSSYESFIAGCMDAASSTVPDGRWLENMKTWIQDFLSDPDKQEMALDATEVMLEKATEAVGATHWVPTVETTTLPTTTPDPTTPTGPPEPAPKDDSSWWSGPVMIAVGAASWLVPICYYAFKKYRGKSFKK